MSDDKTKGHTALPVRLALTDETTIIDADNVHLLTIAGDYDTDDERMAAWAALIVRAVNCHEDLVKALKDARARLMHLGYVPAGKHGRGDPEITEIDAVLKRAKEQTP